jgi:type I restriction enzyme, S subunit
LRMNCWDIYKIGELCDVITGSTPSRNNSEYWNEGRVPWFTVDDIRKGGRVIHNTIQHVTEKAVEESSLRLMPADTVLLCCTASVGEYAITRVPITSNQQFNGLVIKPEFKDKLSADFLFNVASTLKEKLKAFCGKTSVDFVSGSNLKSIQIPLPPLAEQRKIAEILRTWDEAIKTAEAELKAKQDRKRGLMQKILSPGGQIKAEKTNSFRESVKRFALPSDWRWMFVRDVAKVSFSSVDKKSVEGERAVRLCNYMDVFYNRRIREGMPFMVSTASESDIKKFTLNKGDVVLTKDSETPEEIAFAAVIDEQIDKLVCGYHLAVLRPDNDKVTGEYLMSAINFHPNHHQFIRLANGATRFGLGIDSLNNAVIPVPPMDVQRNIAEILKSADAEVELINKRIDFLRIQKRGIMQKLLTGEVRVAA